MLMAQSQTMLQKKYQQVNSALHRTSHHVVAAAYGLHALVRDSRCVQMSFAASTATHSLPARLPIRCQHGYPFAASTAVCIWRT
jgi:23S rRNA pseudoU1915 N3-methylase RlmH